MMLGILSNKCRGESSFLQDMVLNINILYIYYDLDNLYQNSTIKYRFILLEDYSMLWSVYIRCSGFGYHMILLCDISFSHLRFLPRISSLLPHSDKFYRGKIYLK